MYGSYVNDDMEGGEAIEAIEGDESVNDAGWGRYSNIFLPQSSGSKCPFHTFCKNAMVAADMDQLGLEVVRWRFLGRQAGLDDDGWDRTDA